MLPFDQAWALLKQYSQTGLPGMEYRDDMQIFLDEQLEDEKVPTPSISHIQYDPAVKRFSLMGDEGEKISTITSDYQIICITHLPQIAVMADKHFYINKKVIDGFTSTHVDELNEEDKLTEVARMLSGSLTDTAKQNAKEMLMKARTFKNIS